MRNITHLMFSNEGTGWAACLDRVSYRCQDQSAEVTHSGAKNLSPNESLRPSAPGQNCGDKTHHFHPFPTINIFRKLLSKQTKFQRLLYIMELDELPFNWLSRDNLYIHVIHFMCKSSIQIQHRQSITPLFCICMLGKSAALQVPGGPIASAPGESWSAPGWHQDLIQVVIAARQMFPALSPATLESCAVRMNVHWRLPKIGVPRIIQN
jgi:hypothetical protein